MVTSGIYLIVRSNVLYEIVRESGVTILGVISTPNLVAIIGALTALFAGLIAFTQFDVKKVLAYSTVSQLGFMVAAAGMGAYVAAMFHLITHAFFKALLFLGSGSIIHGMEHGHHHVAHEHGHDEPGSEGSDDDLFDPQDMRFMGNLRRRMPLTYAVYLIGALTLAGIFPFAGFWSKDEILAHELAHNVFVFAVLVIASFCTAFYVGRQLRMIFFGQPRHAAAEHAAESPPIMTRPLIVLAVLSVVGGLLNLPFLTQRFAAANNEHAGGIWLVLEGWLEHSIAAFELSEEGLLHLPHTPIVVSPVVAVSTTLLAVIALAGAFFVYRNRPRTAEERDVLQGTPIWWFSVLPLDSFYMKGVVPLFNRLARWLADVVDWRFWHDFVHDNLIRDFFVTFANFLADILDVKGVDGIVNGLGQLTRRLAGTIRVSQTGYARTYALSVFLGAVLLLVYFLWMAR
jgi:NADH-quinone oxidoreductase subunit L